MKYLLAGVLVLIVAFSVFAYKKNQADKERIKQAGIAHQQKLEQEKLDQLNAEKSSNEKRIKAQQERLLKAEKEKEEQYKQLQNNENARIKAKELEKKELNDFKVVFDKWMTQDNIASSTARVSVANPVTELRKIRDELNTLKITGCLVGAKSKLLSAMDDEILMFVYFMQNDVRSAKKIEELKISYFNNLADAIEQNTACKNS